MRFRGRDLEPPGYEYDRLPDRQYKPTPEEEQRRREENAAEQARDLEALVTYERSPEHALSKDVRRRLEWGPAEVKARLRAVDARVAQAEVENAAQKAQQRSENGRQGRQICAPLRDALTLGLSEEIARFVDHRRQNLLSAEIAEPLMRALVQALAEEIGTVTRSNAIMKRVWAPTLGIHNPGFIDNSQGANVRTLPFGQGASQEVVYLPPCAPVVVSGHFPGETGWLYVTTIANNQLQSGYVQDFRINLGLPEPLATLYPSDELYVCDPEMTWCLVLTGYDTIAFYLRP